MPAQRRTIAERVNDYLVEPEGAQFVNGKWKFWFVAIAFLSVINAALTWLIFRDDSENYSGPIMLSVGALVAWLCVGALHYSDSTDRSLARGVSALDSIALLFVVIHFAGLLYVHGHHRTLRSAEARYEAQAVAYNTKAEKVSDDNKAIATSAERIEIERTKRARIENDTVYQARKAAQAGAKVQTGSSSGGVAPSLSTAPIELEKPKAPVESSVAFLTKWDWLIRLANCGELLLACLTLILIRNVSARSNKPTMEFFPVVSARSPAPVGNLTTKKEIAKKHTSFDPEGLKRLREALKDISFRLKGLSFKTSVSGDAVWVVMVRANNGTQETIASAKAKLSLLDDAIRMERGAFRDRLERFLRENGFSI